MGFKFLLLPVSWINAATIRFRNHLFDIGIWKSVEFEFPLIYVGSLSKDDSTFEYSRVITESLIKSGLSGSLHLNKGDVNRRDLEVLSSNSFLYFNEINGKHFVEEQTPMFVTRNKILGVSEYSQFKTGLDFMVLNDHFGVNEIRPSLKILVVDGHRPFYKDRIYPLGNLSELKSSARTADVIWVTSACSLKEQTLMRSEMEDYLNANSRIYFFELSHKQDKKLDKIDNQLDRDNFVTLIENHVNSVKNIASEE